MNPKTKPSIGFSTFICGTFDRHALKQALRNLIVERELAVDIADLSSVPRS